MGTEAEGFADEPMPGMPVGEVPALDLAGLDHQAARIRVILDDALGPEGSGAPWLLAERVALLAGRCKAAEAEVMRLKGVEALPGMPGADL